MSRMQDLVLIDLVKIARGTCEAPALWADCFSLLRNRYRIAQADCGEQLQTDLACRESVQSKLGRIYKNEFPALDPQRELTGAK